MLFNLHVYRHFLPIILLPIALSLSSFTSAQQDLAQTASNSSDVSETNVSIFDDDYFGLGLNVAPDGVVRSLFAIGQSIDISAPVKKSSHLVGQTVHVSSDLGGDLYVVGQTVTLKSAVAGDVSTMAMNFVVGDEAIVSGNMRGMALSMVIDGKIDGGLVTSAKVLTLNGEVAGDVHFAGETLKLGENAKIGGQLNVRMPEKPDLSGAKAITSEQLTYTKLEMETGDIKDIGWNIATGAIIGSLVWAILSLALAGLIIWLMRARFLAAAVQLSAVPLRTFGQGALIFAAVLGLIPLIAMSLIGLVVLPIYIPIMVIAVQIAWMMGLYAFARLVADRVNFLNGDSFLQISGLIIVAAIVLYLLSIAPFIGLLAWIICLAITIAGMSLLLGTRFAKWSRLPE